MLRQLNLFPFHQLNSLLSICPLDLLLDNIYTHGPKLATHLISVINLMCILSVVCLIWEQRHHQSPEWLGLTHVKIQSIWPVFSPDREWMMLQTSFDLYEIMSSHHVDGLVQERRSSIANALELCLSSIDPSNCDLYDDPMSSHYSQTFLPSHSWQAPQKLTVSYCCS